MLLRMRGRPSASCGSVCPHETSRHITAELSNVLKSVHSTRVLVTQGARKMRVGSGAWLGRLIYARTDIFMLEAEAKRAQVMRNSSYLLSRAGVLDQCRQRHSPDLPVAGTVLEQNAASSMQP